MPADPTLIPAKLAAVKDALRVVIAPLTYMGISVAAHVTDAELESLAVAAVNAVDDVENQAAPAKPAA